MFAVELEEVLGGPPGLSAKYCQHQLELAEKYNPQHDGVRGFVGASTLTGSSS
jgi:hypothetical protein